MSKTEKIITILIILVLLIIGITTVSVINSGKMADANDKIKGTIEIGSSIVWSRNRQQIKDTEEAQLTKETDYSLVYSANIYGNKSTLIYGIDKDDTIITVQHSMGGVNRQIYNKLKDFYNIRYGTPSIDLDSTESGLTTWEIGGIVTGLTASENYTKIYISADKKEIKEGIPKNTGPDFRQVSWGMTREEVDYYEDEELIESGSGFVIADFNKSIGIVYEFEDNKLVTVAQIYDIGNLYIGGNGTPDKRMKLYNDLKEELTLKYGAPIEIIGGNLNLYKNDAQKYEAMRSGYITYHSSWIDNERTAVQLELKATKEPYDCIGITITYVDNNYLAGK